MEVQDILHHALTLALGERLYTAPLSKDIKNALDIGTGTGKIRPSLRHSSYHLLPPPSNPEEQAKGFAWH